MRTNWSDANRARNLAIANVDHVDGVAVGAWFTHAGISIDRDVNVARVGRDSSFVTAYSDRDGGEGAAQVRFNEQNLVFRLVDNHQGAFFGGRPRTGVDLECEEHQRKSNGEH